MIIMKKQTLSLLGLSILAFSFISVVNAQSNEKALRHEPNINEDEIIFCVKDVEHKAYYGQVSCFISPSDDLLDKQTADKIYNKASSLDNTFEMGLID